MENFVLHTGLVGYSLALKLLNPSETIGPSQIMQGEECWPAQSGGSNSQEPHYCLFKEKLHSFWKRMNRQKKHLNSRSEALPHGAFPKRLWDSRQGKLIRREI